MSKISFAPISEYCEILGGFAFKSENLGNQGIPVIKIANITDDFRVEISSTQQYFPEDMFTKKHEKYMLKNRDIVIAMTGAKVGKIGRIRNNSEKFTLLNQRVARISCDTIDPDYLWAAIRNPGYNRIFSDLASGAAQPNMSAKQIGSVEVPIFPKIEEVKIGELSNLFDSAVEIKSDSQETCQQIVSTLFRSWFIDFDPVKAKVEGKLPYGMDEETATLFPDKFEDSEFGEIPAGWTIGTIHDIAKQKKDIAKPDEFGGKLPYIGLEHMPRNSIALTEWGVSEGLESNKFHFSKKDILFGKLRPYFHKVGPAPLEGVCSTDILVIQPIDEKLGGFLLPILSSEHFVNFVSGISEGVGLPRTKWEHFKLYKIALPPIEIREKFVSLVDPLFQIIESSIHESKSLEHARNALLPRLMNGELSIS